MNKLLLLLLLVLCLVAGIVLYKMSWNPDDIKEIPVEVWNELNNLPSETPLINPNDYLEYDGKG